MTSAKDIWSNLESRFSLTNGSRKYKLSKELFDTKQQNLSINEYYTAMKSIWEELDNLNALPVVNDATDDVKQLLAAIALQKEESKLFQFLNGVNDDYNHQRSQFTWNNPSYC